MGVPLQEGHGDVAVQIGEDRLAAGPVLVQQRGELVDGGDLGLDVVGPLAGEGLQVEGGLLGWLQPRQQVAVGAQVVGELHAVAGVGLGLGGAPAGPHGVEGVRVDRHDRVPGGRQPVHGQAPGGLDGNGQIGRVAVLAQPREGLGEPFLGVGQFPPVDPLTGLVHDRHVMGLGRPVPSDEHARRTPVLREEHLPGGEVVCRELINRPPAGRVPEADQTASARRGWRNSRWPSNGSRQWPCTHRDREVTTLLVRAAEGMIL